MSSLKPITLYGHATGPNPWKVAMVFEELNVPYNMIIVPKADLKKPDYEKININGRAPAIEDPNSGITLWESGAIIEYLVAKYDKQGKLGFAADTTEYWQAKQWLFFQVSGQGPYFGQGTWFAFLHHEKIPSAIDRYINEIHRVTGVLNRALIGKMWLVGSRYSFVDVSFVTWYEAVVPRVVGDGSAFWEKYPNVKAWLDRIKARPAVANVLKAKAVEAAKAKK